MIARSDISEKLIHFTKKSDCGEPDAVLSKILREGRLTGGTGFIRDGYLCVCFMETPLQFVAEKARSSTWLKRYSHFGLMFDKRWIHARGGRPVIYQPKAEFEQLPESLRWRHVTYEPDTPVDFTWEREWRLPCQELRFTPEDVVVVVPDCDAILDLERDHDWQQHYEMQAYALILGESEAELYYRPFPRRFATLFE